MIQIQISLQQLQMLISNTTNTIRAIVSTKDDNTKWSNLKLKSSKKYEVKGYNIYNYNRFMTSQNLHDNFFNEFPKCVFPQDPMYLRFICKSL